jgi:hypothetical protein
MAPFYRQLFFLKPHLLATAPVIPPLVEISRGRPYFTGNVPIFQVPHSSFFTSHEKASTTHSHSTA